MVSANLKCLNDVAPPGNDCVNKLYTYVSLVWKKESINFLHLTFVLGNVNYQLIRIIY